MRTSIKGLNSNETYCCIKEDVKSFFGDADIDVYFGTFNMSRNENKNSIQYRPNKNCEDRLIARMVVSKRYVDVTGLELNSYLSFFIMNKDGYSDELRLKFVAEILPELKELYEKHKEDDLQGKERFNVTIGLKNDCFNLYASMN